MDTVPVFWELYKEDERLEEAKNNWAVCEHRKGIVGFLCSFVEPPLEPWIVECWERLSTKRTLCCSSPARGHPKEILSLLSLGIVGDLHTSPRAWLFLNVFFNSSFIKAFGSLNTKLSSRFISRRNGILFIGCAAPKG